MQTIMISMDPMDPAAACVALNLRRLSRVVTRRYESTLKPLSLTSFQFSALVALSKHQAIPQTALADAFGMSVSTLNRNIIPLRNRNAVEVTPSAKDRRIKIVRITRSGRQLLAKAMPLWRTAQSEALKKIGEDDWWMLKSKLNKILD